MRSYYRRLNLGGSPSTPLSFEQLEPRSLLAAVITVNTAADEDIRNASLSLREAILVNNRSLAVSSLTPDEQAQVSGTTGDDSDQINFNIPATDPRRNPTTGVFTITPTASPLPDITETVTIDGYTQPGASPNSLPQGNNATLLIELNGSSTPQGNGLTLTNPGSTIIRGLVINRFAGPDAAGISATSGLFHLLEGNRIGTNASGTLGLGNTNGIRLVGASAIIGGPEVSQQNLISANTAAGITMLNSDRTTVVGNRIGTTANGTQPLGNGTVGVRVDNSPFVQIGTLGPDIGNVIAATQAGPGLLVLGDSRQTVVWCNFIGTDVTGAIPLGNGNATSGGGIVIRSDFVGDNALNVGIVGPPNAAENTIAFNIGPGIAVITPSGVPLTVPIGSNRIHSNTGLGIDLGNDGVTPNDDTDNDTGPNSLQNFPELTSAAVENGLVRVQGFLQSVPNQEFAVSFFSNTAPDPSGFGEGQIPLGGQVTVTDDSGFAQLNFVFPQNGARFVTATATSGGTSEFSAAIPISFGCSLTINTTLDVVNGNDSLNSLREAIRCANLIPGPDTLTLPAGTYTLTIPGQNENAAATGDLDITDSLTLIGASAATTIIQAGPTPGAGIDRVLQIVGGTPAVSISNITIQHGTLTDSGIGGGILSEGTLSLTVVVTGNRADRGGGLYHTSASTLTITRSTLTANTADKGGALLNNAGVVAIFDSTVAGNTATTQGGGILNTGESLSLTRATVSGNSAGSGGGGGIFNRAPLSAVNSTISGNTTAGSGGGIHASAGGTFDLLNVTIANNTADSDSDGSGDGGGAFNSTASAIVQNSIVADNIDTGSESPDFAGTLISAGYNLLENTSGLTITGQTIGNILNQDPQLGPLANNGGLTQTHALSLTSPAIDAADPAEFPPADQRGVGRPRGDGPDIGAYEAQIASRLPVCQVVTFNEPGQPGTAAAQPNADSGGTVLIVTGTDGPDVIVIEPRPANRNQLRVKLNGQHLALFNRNSIQQIVVFGLAGNDVVVLNATLTHQAKLFGGDGDDQLFAARSNDGLDGGEGSDQLFGLAGNDTLCGGPGNDFLFGQQGHDFAGGGAGDDHLYGEAGNDLLLGNAGHDFLLGGAGNDRLYGQAGNDQLFGHVGNDLAVGGIGDDKLFGGAGRDVLIGGLGSDFLSGEAGDDLLIGSATAHDQDDAALLRVLQEWSSSRRYAARVNNLRAGSGAAGGNALNDSTLSPDNTLDTLIGSSNQDWFFADLFDLLKDRTRAEAIN